MFSSFTATSDLFLGVSEFHQSSFLKPWAGRKLGDSFCSLSSVSYCIALTLSCESVTSLRVPLRKMKPYSLRSSVFFDFDADTFVVIDQLHLCAVVGEMKIQCVVQYNILERSHVRIPVSLEGYTAESLPPNQFPHFLFSHFRQLENSQNKHHKKNYARWILEFCESSE